jgi:hypothetical protein
LPIPAVGMKMKKTQRNLRQHLYSCICRRGTTCRARSGITAVIVVLAAWGAASADPININVPNGAPLPMSGRVTFNNARQYPQYTLLIWSGGYKFGDVMRLRTARKDVLDSVKAAEFADSVFYRPMVRDFLNSDPRILCAAWTPPPIPPLAYTLAHGGCKITEDECHIVKLDSTGFEAEPVRAIYGFVDTDHKLMTTVRLSYRNPSVRPEPNMFLLHLRYPDFYQWLSFGFLLAFVTTIFVVRRRWQGRA